MRAKVVVLTQGLMAAGGRLRKTTAAPAEDKSPSKDWPLILDWAEKQGTESMKARFTTADLLAKESQATLTVLLAGVGGSAAYATKMLDPGPAATATWGFAAACAYLSALSIVLIMRCLRFQSYPAQFQTPKNLLQRGFTLNALREVELGNLTLRIEEATKINDQRASALNAIRVATALSPAVFLFAALFAAPIKSSQPVVLTISCTQPSSPSASASAMGISCKFSQ